MYKGIPLRKGETFKDGCDKICRCEDTMLNDVVCDDRYIFYHFCNQIFVPPKKQQPPPPTIFCLHIIGRDVFQMLF